MTCPSSRSITPDSGRSYVCRTAVSRLKSRTIRAAILLRTWVTPRAPLRPRTWLGNHRIQVCSTYYICIVTLLRCANSPVRHSFVTGILLVGPLYFSFYWSNRLNAKCGCIWSHLTTSWSRMYALCAEHDCASLIDAWAIYSAANIPCITIVRY